MGGVRRKSRGFERNSVRGSGVVRHRRHHRTNAHEDRHTLPVGCKTVRTALAKPRYLSAWIGRRASGLTGKSRPAAHSPADGGTKHTVRIWEQPPWPNHTLPSRILFP